MTCMFWVDKEYLAYISAYSEHVFYFPADTQKRKYIGIILQVHYSKLEEIAELI